MLVTIYILLFLCLIFIVIEDFKHRLVHIGYYLGTFVASTAIFFIKNPNFHNIYKSLLFLCFNFFALRFYMYLKNKKLNKDLLFGGVAIGDIVFLIVVIPLFNFINYAFFYVAGMLFSLLLFFLIKSLKLDNKETVPLAGYLSVFLLLILSVSTLFEVNLYNKIVL